MKKVIIWVTLIFFMLSITTILHSYPTGITGRTLKNTTNGCSSCHTFGTGVTASFTGPDTVVAGQTVQFSLVITKTVSGKLGCNIAAQNGTLAIASGNTYLKLLNGELTHQSAINLTTVTLPFNYTAPSTPGRDTLYATVDAGHAGNWNWAPNKKIVIKPVTKIIPNSLPINWYLKQNFPNPFNPTTKILYGVLTPSNVKITLYDISGKLITTLVNHYHNAGNYEFEFDAEKYDLSSGVYFYIIEAGEFYNIKRMMLVK